MVSCKYLAVLGILSASVFSQNAMAVDQLPLPHVGNASVNVEIREFASADTPRKVSTQCTQLSNNTQNNDEKIRAIKAYRECRSQEALQQLAVWRWQEASNY